LNPGAGHPRGASDACQEPPISIILHNLGARPDIELGSGQLAALRQYPSRKCSSFTSDDACLQTGPCKGLGWQ
jgi:hypothetical protein